MNEIEALEALVDRWIDVQNFGAPDIALKIELLPFVLEKWKHARRRKFGRVTFEEFAQSTVFADLDKLIIAAPQSLSPLGSGIYPIQLQKPLIVFLLLNHRARRKVLETIELFVERIWDKLDFLDFKKTKTGATRCFTNTRFAALTLRDYGLLKFTSREAFKTWELSLTGFLAAARLLEKRSSLWEIPLRVKDGKFDLLPEIRDCCDDIKDYDQFAARLASICKPNVEIFRTFKPALKNGFDLLDGYWRVVRDPDLPAAKRKEASLERIKQLEREGITAEFYNEFSQCLNVKLLTELWDKN